MRRFDAVICDIDGCLGPRVQRPSMRRGCSRLQITTGGRRQKAIGQW